MVATMQQSPVQTTLNILHGMCQNLLCCPFAGQTWAMWHTLLALDCLHEMYEPALSLNLRHGPGNVLQQHWIRTSCMHHSMHHSQWVSTQMLQSCAGPHEGHLRNQ